MTCPLCRFRLLANAQVRPTGSPRLSARIVCADFHFPVSDFVAGGVGKGIVPHVDELDHVVTATGVRGGDDDGFLGEIEEPEAVNRVDVGRHITGFLRDLLGSPLENHWHLTTTVGKPIAVDAAALHSILHDHRRIVEFDGRIDMKLFANHRSDALVHERTGGTFIVPQIDSASGPAVLRTQELFPD